MSMLIVDNRNHKRTPLTSPPQVYRAVAELTWQTVHNNINSLSLPVIDLKPTASTTMNASAKEKPAAPTPSPAIRKISAASEPSSIKRPGTLRRSR